MPANGILPPDTIVRRADDGTLYAHSPHPLGAYPRQLTVCLEAWAACAPERTFLARRNAAGEWTRLTYRAALRGARAVAQALVDRRLSAERPVVILSGNGLEHAILALGAMYAGVPYAPIAPAYSLVAREFTTLKHLWRSLTPGLVFAAEGPDFARALSTVTDTSAEVVTCVPLDDRRTTAFEALLDTPVRADVDAAHARVGPETVAKVLFTSGSTGAPKGVINTQRMLCSNQEMLRTVMPLLGDTPPVLCDWLPWNHTFGGNHNFGIVLYNGGTLYIDDGKPTPERFEVTLRNLREIATTAYFNVPRGYDLLVPQLRADPGFAAHFFSRVEMLFCAAAALRQQVADDLSAAAVRARGQRVPLVTGLGATESSPFALCAGDADFTGGRIGVPAPGVELKAVPVGRQFEGRLRGPNITPGYWRDAALTAAAFDDEGFYKLGDALGLVDPDVPERGFVFEGRLSEDFKLSTGTWVRVGPLRAALLAALGDLVHDVVVAGHDRDFVAALIFPSEAARRRMGFDPLREACRASLETFAAGRGASSTTVRRAVLLETPPAIDAHELTEKGSVNQKAVLGNRQAIVELLYAAAPPDTIIAIGEGQAIRATSYSD